MVLTPSLELCLDENRPDVVVGWVTVVVSAEDDRDVVLGEDLSDGLSGVHVEQIVGTDDDHSTPLVLCEDLEQELTELAEGSEGPGQRRVGDLVVEVRVSCHPRDDGYVEDRSYLSNSTTRCAQDSELCAQLQLPDVVYL